MTGSPKQTVGVLNVRRRPSAVPGGFGPAAAKTARPAPPQDLPCAASIVGPDASYARTEDPP